MSSVPAACACVGPAALSSSMTGKNREPSKAETARAARLRQALRQNLKRRKAQQRARAGGVAVSHDSAGFAADKPNR